MRTSAGTGARVKFPSVLFLSCAAYRKTKVIANPPPVLGFRGTAIALVQRVIAANFRSIAVWHSKQTFYLPELDALRFFAFLAVFLCHVAVRDGRFTWEARTLLAGGWLYGLGGGLSQTFGFSLAAVGCGGLLLASIGARWMRNGWMGYLGHISYGLYVFHLPTIVITQMLVPRFAVGPTSLLFTVGVAAVSYRYLERQFLKLRERFQYVRSQPLLKEAA